MPYGIEEIENLKRSVAMAPTDGPSGLSRAVALTVLTELAKVTGERDRLVVELGDAGLA